ncbi:uncharacterized protein LOC120329377 [Styela clava]
MFCEGICQIFVLLVVVSLARSQHHSVYVDPIPGNRCSAGCVSPGICPLGYFRQTKYPFDYCCYVDEVAFGKLFDSKVASLKMLDCRNRDILNFELTATKSDTESIDFSFSKFRNKLPEIRLNFLKYFTQLKVLTLSSSNVNHLPSDFLSAHTLLEDLYLNWNDITEIPENFFENNPNLVKIDFTGNRLESIPANLFKRTPNLDDVNLSYNNLQHITSDTFKFLTNLRYLDLSYNEKVRCISSKVFKFNKSLVHVSLNELGNRVHRGLQKTYCSTKCRYNIAHLRFQLKINERGRWQTRLGASCSAR